ncbi:MAG: glycosyltransferase [Chloroflexi bacterium]|nr:MAG: glycosyltransferase [Chloroflexota bacterium]
MDILFLEPQPFYKHRGSPIAVHLLLKVLSQQGHRIDLVTYAEGETVAYNQVEYHRIPQVPFVHHIRAGFSWKKTINDILMIFVVFSLLIRRRYHVVWAVEEMAFLGVLLKLLFGIPYVYDMDSSLAQQLVEQFPRLARFTRTLEFFEGIAVKHATVVVPVCDALVEDIQKYHPQKTVTLRDVSLLDEISEPVELDLRTQLGLNGDPMLMYVGNLEAYQGIDLLLEGFAMAAKQTRPAELVIVGGAEQDIQQYVQKSRKLGVEQRVHFLGPKPIQHLSAYLSQADILVSPRTKGRNTPMKIYSYLDSGKPLLATNMETHTQAFGPDVAELADPTPPAFSASMVHLIENEALRHEFGQKGRQLVQEKYSFTAFRRTLNQLIDWLEYELGHQPENLVKTKPVAYLSKEI